MKRMYVYSPFIEKNVYSDTVMYDHIEDITDYSVPYAVLDALSQEYYFSIHFE